MAVGDTLSTGSADLRKEFITKTVTGFALQEYVFKQLVMISKSNSWKETYFREMPTELSGSAMIQGVPRNARFPYDEPKWTEYSNRQIKFAIEGKVSWEDQRTNDINVIARTLLRLSRAVTKQVDAHIWNTLTTTATFAGSNLVTILPGDEWDSATIANRDPINDILHAIRLIEEQNYNPYKNGFLLLNPLDFQNLMANPNIRNAAEFYTADVTKNGRIGRICGLTIIKSNNVTADNAAVIVAKECGNFKQVQSLKVDTIVEPSMHTMIRIMEMGVCQLTNPLCVCGITNTTTTA